MEIFHYFNSEDRHKQPKVRLQLFKNTATRILKESKRLDYIIPIPATCGIYKSGLLLKPASSWLRPTICDVLMCCDLELTTHQQRHSPLSSG